MFNWSMCRHGYSTECAQVVVVEAMTKGIPCVCVHEASNDSICNIPLLIKDAAILLNGSYMQMFLNLVNGDISDKTDKHEIKEKETYKPLYLGCGIYFIMQNLN